MRKEYMDPSWFTVRQIHPHIFGIAEFQHEEQVVSYLVLGVHHAFLIDTGLGYADIHAVVQQITLLPITVLLTHSHWDHIGGIASFHTIMVFDDPWEKEQLHKKQGGASIRYIQEQSLSGDIHIDVIHTPGHTPGSVCYYFPEYHALFTGDTIYTGPIYAHLPESDVSAYAQSAKKLLHFVQDDPEVRLFPGHNAMEMDKQAIIDLDRGFSAIQAGTLAVSSVIGHTKTYIVGSLSILLRI